MELDEGTALRLREPWRERAACRGLDPELFFPVPGGSAGTAVAVCAGCPVRVECLAYALHAAEKFGVWGGQPEARRTVIRRKRRRGAV
ncbi:MAG: WhiB family transcriptional regulator [Acidimicrobiia bacterium]